MRPSVAGRAITGSGRPRVSTTAAIAGRAAVANELMVALGVCVGLWYADRGLTLGGTLLAQGTTPPVVTITGATGASVGLHLEIDSVAGGTGLGQATFKVSLDNGSSYLLTGQLTGASVALGAGLVASFAAGPYNINNKWDGTVSGQADQSGVGRHLLQATAAKQMLCVAPGVNLQPVVRGDGVDDFLQTTLFSVAQPWHFFIVFKTRTLGAPYPGQSVVFGSQNGLNVFCLDDTTPRTVFTTDTANLIGPASAIANGAFADMNVVANGASSKMRSLGIQVGAGQTGAQPLTGLTVAALFDGTGANAIDVAMCALYSAEVPLAALVRMEKFAKARWRL